MLAGYVQEMTELCKVDGEERRDMERGECGGEGMESIGNVNEFFLLCLRSFAREFTHRGDRLLGQPENVVVMSLFGSSAAGVWAASGAAGEYMSGEGLKNNLGGCRDDFNTG